MKIKCAVSGNAALQQTGVHIYLENVNPHTLVPGVFKHCTSITGYCIQSTLQNKDGVFAFSIDPSCLLWEGLLHEIRACATCVYGLTLRTTDIITVGTSGLESSLCMKTEIFAGCVI